jgi:hypothetical protein
MRYAFAVLLLIAATMFAQIMDDSDHYRDASTFYSLIVSQGYQCVVTIQPNNYGVANYIVYYNRNFSGTGGLERFIGAVVATAIVSSDVSWSSNALLVMFDDTWLTITTANCRYLKNNYTRMTSTQIENWILANVVSAPNPSQ